MAGSRPAGSEPKEARHLIGFRVDLASVTRLRYCLVKLIRAPISSSAARNGAAPPPALAISSVQKMLSCSDWGIIAQAASGVGRPSSRRCRIAARVRRPVTSWRVRRRAVKTIGTPYGSRSSTNTTRASGLIGVPINSAVTAKAFSRLSCAWSVMVRLLGGFVTVQNRFGFPDALLHGAALIELAGSRGRDGLASRPFGAEVFRIPQQEFETMTGLPRELGPMGKIPGGNDRSIGDADTGHEFGTQGIGLGIARRRDTVGVGVGRRISLPDTRAVVSFDVLFWSYWAASACLFPAGGDTGFRQFGLHFSLAPFLVKPGIIALI